MGKAEYESLLKELNENELYRKSKSIHKKYQFCQFTVPGTKDLLEGQQVRREDAKLISQGEEGYDEKTSRLVIYSFKNGALDSEGERPAVEYPGHYEIWHHGMLAKVWADGGDTIEYWENGVPVRIDTNLLAKTGEK